MSTVNFDSLHLGSDGYSAIEGGYKGLNWDNIYAVNPAKFEAASPGFIEGSGYDTGLTSGMQEGYSGIGNPSTFSSSTGGTFSLKSIEMTSAWNTKEKVDVTAYDVNNNLIHEKTVTISDSGPSLVKFNWDDVSSVTFTPTNYTQDPNLQYGGDNIVFDDIKIAHVRAVSAAGVHADMGHSHHGSDMLGEMHGLGSYAMLASSHELF